MNRDGLRVYQAVVRQPVLKRFHACGGADDLHGGRNLPAKCVRYPDPIPPL